LLNAALAIAITPGTQDRESTVLSEINQTDKNTYFEKH
jgi:tellurite resistance protein